MMSIAFELVVIIPKKVKELEGRFRYPLLGQKQASEVAHVVSSLCVAENHTRVTL